MTNRAAILLVVCAGASDARAGGMVLPVRGVRTVERAGALIAGSDDADSLWLDPAGLAHLAGDGKKQLLFDAAYVYQSVDYARIDSGGNRLPPVSNQQPGQPIPTLAAALGIGDRLVIAGGIAAPYAALHTYEADGAQRYASVSLANSAFVYVTLGAAYKLGDRLRVGATVMDVFSKVVSRVVLSGCPGQTVCAPEDPEFDALGQDIQTDYLSPSGSIGVQYDAARIATLGLAVQAPSRVSATGTFTSRLPSSGFFEGARVVGDQSELSLTLPAIVRAGIEVRPTPALRIEAALDVELWSMHDEIAISPRGVRIENAAGVGTYVVGELAIPRKYQTSFAPAIGVEWHGPTLMLGAGYSYETAAAKPGYVSVLTVDSTKHLVGVGGGYGAGGWQIGVSAGFVALADVHVPLAEAKVPELTPLRDQPSTVMINAGSYKSHYLIAGLRFARWF
ncbi:MAG TPA: outer membrane protein transport protein [Kofleriaceae bacterium]|nr:outer membrane protein transport protein [Kofleriaceae bacterium]